VWFVTPSLYGSCIRYSSPVSWRFRKIPDTTTTVERYGGRGGAAVARHGKKAAGDIMTRLKAAADASLDRHGSGATRRLDNRAVDDKIDIVGRLSAVAEQGGSFRDIPKSPEKASVLFRRIDDADIGLHVSSGGKPGGPRRPDLTLPEAGVARRRTVPVATGRIRRGPTHLDGKRGAEQAAALVRDIRKSAQEKFFTIAVDEGGKILNLHKYSKGRKNEALVNSIEAAGFAANLPGVKKVYTIHNHPGGTAKASSAKKRRCRHSVNARLTRLSYSNIRRIT